MSVDRVMASSLSHMPVSTPRRTLTVQEKYLLELLDEKEKLVPFVSIFPNAVQLLYKEIISLHTLLRDASLVRPNGSEEFSPSINGILFSGEGTILQSWKLACEINRMRPPNTQRFSSLNSRGFAKKTIRIGIPVDKYPTFNFVGRLLGPRGNTLKRLEMALSCRILIRGRGSVKDPNQEEMMRQFPGMEHLYEPLHILIKAKLPKDIINICLMKAREVLEAMLQPMDEAEDILKQEQLRELAILNGQRLAMSSSLVPMIPEDI